MTCKDCIHFEVCKMHYQQKCELTYDNERDVKKAMKRAEQGCPICEHFKARSQFVKLPKAHWVRHSPNMSIMREFHKQGIGSGMSENSIFWTCSNCGGWGILSYKYCPFCGAKMEDVEQALKEREKDE